MAPSRDGISMLVLDPATGRYDTDAAAGSQLLFDGYDRLLRGEATDDRGDQSVL